MSGTQISITLSGFAESRAKLDGMADKLRRPDVPMGQAAIWLQGQTLRAFRDGGRPEKWAPLSLMSLFIRKHRESAPNDDARVLMDSGRLYGSIIPFVDTNAGTFGAQTNVEYADDNEFGGVSKPSTIRIGAFQRKQTVGKRGGRRTSMVSVKAYTLNLKGGAVVKARPFFPRTPEEFEYWGYLQPVVGIFETYYLGSR